VNRDAPVQIRVRVDTDDERSGKRCSPEGAAEREEFLQPIQVRFFDAKQLGTYLDQEGTITLIMTPAKAVPPFDGYGAVDLGNTSSTLVALSLSDAFYRTDSMRLVDADAARATCARTSTRWCRTSDRPDPQLRTAAARRAALPERAEGRLPADGELGGRRLAKPAGRRHRATAATAGLVLGAKRLVAGKEWEKSQKLMATHRRTYDKTEQFEQVEVLNGSRRN